jgi:hypothetical protein
MKILTIKTKEEYEQAQNLFYYNYGHAGHVHVDGVYKNQSWKPYYPYSGKIYEGAIPKDNSDGNCMDLVGTGSSVIAKSFNCNSGSYTFCEWIKDPKSE